MRQRTDYPTKFIADVRDKCAVTLILYDRLQAHSHFVAGRFVAEFTHERSKPGRVAQLGSANPNLGVLIRHPGSKRLFPFSPGKIRSCFGTTKNESSRLFELALRARAFQSRCQHSSHLEIRSTPR